MTIEPLRVVVDTFPDAVVVRPSGDIDLANAHTLRAEMLGAVREHDGGCLIADLGAVTYIDSAGIEMLFRLFGDLEDMGRELITVAPPGSRAERLLSLAALTDIGSVRASVHMALSSRAEAERAAKERTRPAEPGSTDTGG